jgi:hypothetical protein
MVLQTSHWPLKAEGLSALCRGNSEFFSGRTKGQKFRAENKTGPNCVKGKSMDVEAKNAKQRQRRWATNFQTERDRD